MIVKVMYYRNEAEGYRGGLYTYRTELPLNVGDKVIAPTRQGDNKALVMQVDVPDGQIDERWADRVRDITEYDRTVPGV